MIEILYNQWHDKCDKNLDDFIHVNFIESEWHGYNVTYFEISVQTDFIFVQTPSMWILKGKISLRSDFYFDNFCFYRIGKLWANNLIPYLCYWNFCTDSIFTKCTSSHKMKEWLPLAGESWGPVWHDTSTLGTSVKAWKQLMYMYLHMVIFEWSISSKPK